MLTTIVPCAQQSLLEAQTLKYIPFSNLLELLLDSSVSWGPQVVVGQCICLVDRFMVQEFSIPIFLPLLPLCYAACVNCSHSLVSLYSGDQRWLPIICC